MKNYTSIAASILAITMLGACVSVEKEAPPTTSTGRTVTTVTKESRYRAVGPDGTPISAATTTTTTTANQ